MATRPKEISHDTSPAIITDHPFEPRGEWWTLCKICSLAEAAHAETTLQPIAYLSDDEEEEHAGFKTG